MEEKNLPPGKAAIIAKARREPETLKSGNPPRGGAERAATPAPAAAEDRPKASPAERLAQLMAEERAETARRKTKMRRYGMIISAGILAAFALWLMRVFSRRR